MNSHTLASDDSQCTNGAVRLWSAYDNTPANEGIIQICRSGRWYAMCDSYSYSACHVGGIVCRSLGYSGAISKHNCSITCTLVCNLDYYS